MFKKIIITLILIYITIISKTYATDEIISSQMEAINMKSFIREGEKYTKDVFPDIDLDDLIGSAINGKIDNNKIFKGIISVFGDEIITAISLLRNNINNNSNT